MKLIERSNAAADDVIGKTTVAIQRAVSNAASGWALCDSAGCRRAQCCTGHPRVCLTVCSLLMNPRVWSGALNYVQGRIDGRSFEAMASDCPEEIEALGEWVNRVTRGRRIPRRAPPKAVTAKPAAGRVH
jgi:hypothetical protein